MKVLDCLLARLAKAPGLRVRCVCVWGGDLPPSATGRVQRNTSAGRRLKEKWHCLFVANKKILSIY